MVLCRSEALTSDFRDRPQTLDPPQLFLIDTKLEDFFIETKFLMMLYHSEQERSQGSQGGTKSYLDPRGIDMVSANVV